MEAKRIPSKKKDQETNQVNKKIFLNPKTFQSFKTKIIKDAKVLLILITD